MAPDAEIIHTGGPAMAPSTVCVETYLRLGSVSAIGSCARELIPSLR
jgi:hypothetical protein